mmetsp:Transcript_27128/g.56375  ORF Transcript_27128/g.56375 Transcript_27128/m.56375 type:complete len:242 (-) Transcript_27128:966-1691(-)
MIFTQDSLRIQARYLTQGFQGRVSSMRVQPHLFRISPLSILAPCPLGKLRTPEYPPLHPRSLSQPSSCAYHALILSREDSNRYRLVLPRLRTHYSRLQSFPILPPGPRSPSLPLVPWAQGTARAKTSRCAKWTRRNPVLGPAARCDKVAETATAGQTRRLCLARRPAQRCASRAEHRTASAARPRAAPSTLPVQQAATLRPTAPVARSSAPSVSRRPLSASYASSDSLALPLPATCPPSEA